MLAIVGDPELRRLLRVDGKEIVAAPGVKKMKDAVTGAELVQFEMYFNVPTSGPGKQRFDTGDGASVGPATLDACREQVGALQRELDARREEGEKFDEMERKFRARKGGAAAGAPAPR
jgi:hypothetical protein